MKQLKLATGLILTSLISSLGAFNIQPALAQRTTPSEDAVPLLSTKCVRDNISDSTEDISIGRQIYTAVFRVGRSRLTCKIKPNNSPYSLDTLRLKFGVPDSSNNECKYTVNIYLDGEKKQTKIVTPRKPVTVLNIDVSQVINVSIETEYSNCVPYLYFVQATLEPNYASTNQSYKPLPLPDSGNDSNNNNQNNANPVNTILDTLKTGADTYQQIQNLFK